MQPPLRTQPSRQMGASLAIISSLRFIIIGLYFQAYLLLYVDRSFLLLGLELGLADAGAAELDVEDALHRGEDLLVGNGGTTLEVGDDGGRRVALGG